MKVLSEILHKLYFDIFLINLINDNIYRQIHMWAIARIKLFDHDQLNVAFVQIIQLNNL